MHAVLGVLLIFAFRLENELLENAIIPCDDTAYPKSDQYWHDMNAKSVPIVPDSEFSVVPVSLRAGRARYLRTTGSDQIAPCAAAPGATKG